MSWRMFTRKPIAEPTEVESQDEYIRRWVAEKKRLQEYYRNQPISPAGEKWIADSWADVERNP